MKAIEIRDHFHSLVPSIELDKTVDQIILGDPEKEIHTAMVTWMASFDAVRHAVDRKFDMVICHEPTFWGREGFGRPIEEIEIGKAKKKFIEDDGLVILRNHDVWDRIDRIGIPWTWAKFLDIEGDPVAAMLNGYQHRYDIDPVTLDELARRVAERTGAIGEPAVQVMGDGARKVSKVGIGTGCACSVEVFQKIGCDVSIVCDDGSCYWNNLQCAMDSDHPVIRVNHGTSEEAGMVSLTEYVNENLDGMTAEHLPHGCSFRLMGASS